LIELALASLAGMRGIVFQDPMVLLLLPLALLPFLRGRKRLYAPLACSRVMLPYEFRASAPFARFLGVILRSLSIVLIVIALARPQFGHLPNKRRVEGVDIVLAIDTSGSMRARDFEVNGQRPDRLEVIKAVISQFISARPDDRIGMVVFGSEAYTQSPLTMDHDVLSQFLRQIEIGMAGDGTAIGDGLATSIKRLKDSPTKSRVIVILTDGANNSGRIDPLAAANAAKALGIRVHTIGVGSEGVVPIVQNGRVFQIQADIDEKTLRDISETTGGHYWRAVDTDALISVYGEIDKLEKVRRDQKIKQRGRDIFHVFIAIALCSFAGELLWRLSRFRRIPA
jgi:Ca-activated chloride channel homolog